MTAFVPTVSLTSRPVLSRSSLSGARVSSVATPVRSSVTMSDRSAAMPFMPKPKNISPDMIGYAGFDPLNLSKFFNVKWLQESEIKHGRVCMLAFLGILVQEFFHLPSAQFSNPVATDAFYQVPKAGLWQIFLFCGVAELIMHKGRVSYADMHEEDSVPGQLGFNPMNLKISDSAKLKELKNGRLAMCGVGGVIHSMLLYKTPVIAQLADFKPMPLNF